MKDALLSWGMLVLSVVFNAYGVIIIKLHLNQLGPIKFNSWDSLAGYFLFLLKSPSVISGLLLFFVAPFLFAVALSRMEVTIAYPAQVGLNFLVIFVLGVTLLGESWNLNKLVGVILVLSAIYMLR